MFFLGNGRIESLVQELKVGECEVKFCPRHVGKIRNFHHFLFEGSFRWDPFFGGESNLMIKCMVFFKGFVGKIAQCLGW